MRTASHRFGDDLVVTAAGFQTCAQGEHHHRRPPLSGERRGHGAQNDRSDLAASAETNDDQAGLMLLGDPPERVGGGRRDDHSVRVYACLFERPREARLRRLPKLGFVVSVYGVQLPTKPIGEIVGQPQGCGVGVVVGDSADNGAHALGVERSNSFVRHDNDGAGSFSHESAGDAAQERLC